MKKRFISLASLAVAGSILGVYQLYEQRKQAKFAAASPYEKGWILIEAHGCIGCHQADSGFRAPKLKGLIGQTINLADGRSLVADEAYVRTSLLNPSLHLSAGYQNIMPSYEGQLSDDDISFIIAALKAP